MLNENSGLLALSRLYRDGDDDEMSNRTTRTLLFSTNWGNIHSSGKADAQRVKESKAAKPGVDRAPSRWVPVRSRDRSRMYAAIVG